MADPKASAKAPEGGDAGHPGQVKALRGGKVGTANLDGDAFAGPHHPVVLREAVLMYQANRRVGTVDTLRRGEVRGSTKKMYKQKHTGNARHGDKKAPSFRGGGVAHGPHPRDYRWGMTRKSLRKALQVALHGKFQDGEVALWEGAAFDKPSTKGARSALASLGAAESALVVAAGPVDRNLLLSIRNLPNVRALPAAEVTAQDVVSHRQLVLLEGALDALRGRVGPGEGGTAAGEGRAS